MFILIVGGGKVGTYLARGLLKQHHEVVVIEKDSRKAQMMTNLLEADIAVVGDGCDPTVLLQAGVARADVVVADTGDDEDNLVVVLISKKHSKARCIARVNNPKNKLIFESLDSEQPVIVISSTEIILDIIDDRVNATTLETLARLGKGDLELVQLSILPDSPANGRRIAAIRELGNVRIAAPNDLLKEGDEINAIVSPDALSAFAASFSKSRPTTRLSA